MNETKTNNRSENQINRNQETKLNEADQKTVQNKTNKTNKPLRNKHDQKHLRMNKNKTDEQKDNSPESNDKDQDKPHEQAKIKHQDNANYTNKYT